MSNTPTPKPQGQHFTLTLHGQVMNVAFRPYKFANYGHVEFKSPHTPPRRIPVSETGYLSHFAPMHEIEAFGDSETFIRKLATALLNAKPQDENQLTLF